MIAEQLTSFFLAPGIPALCEKLLQAIYFVIRLSQVVDVINRNLVLCVSLYSDNVIFLAMHDV
jgi:hypothetical protein